jgi:hypothetical protein
VFLSRKTEKLNFGTASVQLEGVRLYRFQAPLAVLQAIGANLWGLPGQTLQVCFSLPMVERTSCLLSRRGLAYVMPAVPRLPCVCGVLGSQFQQKLTFRAVSASVRRHTALRLAGFNILLTVCSILTPDPNAWSVSNANRTFVRTNSHVA